MFPWNGRRFRQFLCINRSPFFSNVLVTVIKKTKGCPLILAKERLGQIESHINAFPFFWFKRHDTKIYLFSQCAYVYEFVCMYLQFYVICIPLQTGFCIMHQIHSSYCFMVCNFPLQYNKSDCNSDIFNKKLDTLPPPLFFFSFIYLGYWPHKVSV